MHFAKHAGQFMPGFGMLRPTASGMASTVRLGSQNSFDSIAAEAGEGTRSPATGHPGKAATGHPGEAATGHPSEAAAGHPSEAATGHPCEAAAGHPGEAAAGQPSEAAAGHPSEAATGHPSEAVVTAMREQVPSVETTPGTGQLTPMSEGFTPPMAKPVPSGLSFDMGRMDVNSPLLPRQLLPGALTCTYYKLPCVTML